LVQLSVIALFILAAYLAFSSSRKAEQNQVWVGMSKETAHQLGTPISSLMAWIEILEQSETEPTYIGEMQKDIDRLQMITDRFSKIGSLPDLPLTDLIKTIDVAVSYMRNRTSANVAINVKNLAPGPIILPLNSSLFNWVIENLIKNAVDAMNGKGTITITIEETDKHATVLVTDTGKGLPKNKFKTIFNPGYTSKDRGWGLGLSLARRIIQNYHNGKIFVLSSEINQGTTFKIILPK
jgi:signal transduction histidine kinase